MSSPNAAGCIALLLSAVINSGFPSDFRHPAYIRRVIENSAKKISHVDNLGQGHGLLQVQSAWQRILSDVQTESLSQNSLSNPIAAIDNRKSIVLHKLLRQVFFNVSLRHGGMQCRGIYLRQADDCKMANTWSVSITPQWHHTSSVDDKVSFEVPLVSLVLQSLLSLFKILL